MHGIVGRIHHDRYPRVILGRRPDHRGPAHVDHLDDLGPALAGRDGLLEGIQVDDHQVEGLDPGRLQVPRVVLAGLIAPAPRRRSWGAGLDPSAQDLGKAGLLLDEGHFDPGCFQGRGRAARRYEQDAELGQRLAELHDAGLVVNGHERAAHRRDGGRNRNRLGHRSRNIAGRRAPSGPGKIKRLRQEHGHPAEPHVPREYRDVGRRIRWSRCVSVPSKPPETPTPFFKANEIVRSGATVGRYVPAATQISSVATAAASAAWRSV